MPIPYNADYNLLLGYKMPEITPMHQRLAEVAKLSDLLDERQLNRKKVEKYYRDEEINKTLGALMSNSFNQDPTLATMAEPVQQVAPQPQAIASTPVAQEPAIAPAQPYGSVAVQNLDLGEKQKIEGLADIQRRAQEEMDANRPEMSYESMFAPDNAGSTTTQGGNVPIPQGATVPQGNLPMPSNAPMGNVPIKQGQGTGQDYSFSPNEKEVLNKAFSYGYDYGQQVLEKMLESKKIMSDIYRIHLSGSKEQTEKDITAAQQRQLEMEIKKHGLITNILSGAKNAETGDYDPQSVSTAVTRARALGFDETRLPQNPTKDQIDDWMAEDMAMRRDSGSKDPYVEQKARFSQEKDLRDSFQSQAKPFVVMRDQYARMMSLDPSNPAGQIGLVYAIMKLYDPGSVVRETEFATAQNAAGVPTVVRNMWNKILSGGILDTTQIGEFKGQAENLYKSAERNFSNLKDQYRKVSMDYGIKPSNVTGGLDIANYNSENGTGENDSNINKNQAIKSKSKSGYKPAINTKIGTKENPYKPKNKSEYDKLPKGVIFVDDDGLKKEKQ
jgi:hypothetical protein